MAGGDGSGGQCGSGGCCPALDLGTAELQATDVELAEEIQNYSVLKRTIDHQNELLAEVERLGSERVAWSGLLLKLAAVVPPGATINLLTLEREPPTLTNCWYGTGSHRFSCV